LIFSTKQYYQPSNTTVLLLLHTINKLQHFLYHIASASFFHSHKGAASFQPDWLCWLLLRQQQPQENSYSKIPVQLCLTAAAAAASRSEHAL